MFLIDTNVAIDALRGHTTALSLLANEIAGGVPILASEITRFEILAGMWPEEEAETETLLDLLAWIPVEERISRRGAELARSYKARFEGIEDGDYLIAATVLEADAELLTTNVRHFPMFSGLEPAY